MDVIPEKPKLKEKKKTTKTRDPEEDLFLREIGGIDSSDGSRESQEIYHYESDRSEDSLDREARGIKEEEKRKKKKAQAMKARGQAPIKSTPGKVPRRELKAKQDLNRLEDAYERTKKKNKKNYETTTSCIRL